MFSQVKNPMDVVNFMNNLESIFDDLVKKHKCFKHDKRTEYMVETGASSEVTKDLLFKIAYLNELQ